MFAYPFMRSGARMYRTLMPWEHGHYAAHLLRLSHCDRRLRFMGTVTEGFIVEHARDALLSPRTKVIACFDGDAPCAAVELALATPSMAEAAFSVEEPFRQCGIGTTLAAKAIRAARNRRLSEMAVVTDADNIAMRRLGARFGAEFACESGEALGVITIRIANVLSVVSEIAEEQAGFTASALAWHRGR